MIFNFDVSEYSAIPSGFLSADVIVAKHITSVFNLLIARSIESAQLQFLIRKGSDEKSGKVKLSSEEQKKVEDEFLRCVDLSFRHVYPSFEPLCLLSDSVRFEGEANELVDRKAIFTLIKPPWSLTQAFTVDGEVVHAHTLPAGYLGNVDSQENDNEIATADEDLWRRTRAVGADAENRAEEMSSDKLQKLKLRLSRLCAERIINENSWSKVKETVKETEAKVRPSCLHRAPIYKDLFAATSATQRAQTHVDSRGMEFNAAIVGYSQFYAYFAVANPSPKSNIGEGSEKEVDPTPYYLVGKIGIPRKIMPVGDVSTTLKGSNNSKKRSREQQKQFSNLENTEEMFPFLKDNKAVDFHLLETPILVVIRAHRVICRPSTSGETRHCVFDKAVAQCSIVFEDAYLMKKIGLVGKEENASGWDDSSSLHSLNNVITLVRQSCNRFLSDRIKYGEILLEAKSKRNKKKQGPVDVVKKDKGENIASADTEKTEDIAEDEASAQKSRLVEEMDRLYIHLCDAYSVSFKKIRGRQVRAAIPSIHTCRDIAALSEGPTLEFKHSVSAYDTEDTSEMMEPPAKSSAGDVSEIKLREKKSFNVERLRNTIVSMSSLLGGVILIGVSDDGTVVGHERGAVLEQLRITGFCPAMVKNAVNLRELRTLGNLDTNTSGEGETTTSDRRTMPKEWWKVGTSAVVTSATADLNHAKKAPVEEEKVVSVITVEKGQAPFYRPSKNGQPYVRGCASSTVMPVLVMVSRIFAHLGGADV